MSVIFLFYLIYLFSLIIGFIILRKGHTTMKKILFLLPILLLSSCNSTRNGKIYDNVSWYFSYESLKYVVNIYDDKSMEIEHTYNVSPRNCYQIEVKEWNYSSTTKTILYNQYFVSSNELFIYNRK